MQGRALGRHEKSIATMIDATSVPQYGIEEPRLLPMRYRWLRWAVPAFSLAFGACSSYFFYLGVLEAGHSRFESDAIGVSHNLDSKIRAYRDVLYAMRGLFDAAGQVTREDFHEFAEALALPKRYPGVTNISFAVRLSIGQKEEFERTVRAEKGPLTKGLPEFSIKPPGERPEYMVVHYLEPMSPEAAAFARGLDLNADPLRSSVVLRARDTGDIASTSGVTLGRDAKSGMKTLLLRLAVYRGKGIPNTVEDRQRLCFGIVGSTIRIGDMVEAALPRQTLARVRVIIREGGEASAGGKETTPGQLLYDSQSRDGTLTATDYSAYAVTEHLNVGDRKWRLDIVPLKNPADVIDQIAVAAILAASFAVSALLFWLMRSLAIAQSRRIELGRRNREVTALSEVTSALQACANVGEAADVIKRFCAGAFPTNHCAVYLYQSSRNYLDVIAASGEQQHVPSFPPNECWALRRGQIYRAMDAQKDLSCAHVKSATDVPKSYCCVPMSAQGNILGLVHLAFGADDTADNENQFRLVGAFTDQLALALANLKLRESLRDQSIRDSLTGLYNRRYLEESLERELARAQRGSHSLAVLMLDADHFKRINDQLGHETGDVVLRELGKTIKESCRASDLPCRFGGEEFTVVLPECRRADALQWGERLLSRIRKLEVKAGGIGVARITISIGLALYPEDGEDRETLLQAADTALYNAKRAGRDRLMAYEDIASGPGPADAKAIPADLKAVP